MPRAASASARVTTGGSLRSCASATATSRLVRAWRPSPAARLDQVHQGLGLGGGPLGLEPPLEQCGHCVERQRLEPEQGRARQQGRVDLEVGVLGGGADEHEQAALDRRQQRVLLRLVEAMDLVEEQDGALVTLAEAVPRPLGDLPHVLDRGGDRRELHVGLGRGVGDQLGQRGLARARAAPTGSPTTGGRPRSGCATAAPGRAGAPGRRPRRASPAASGPPAGPGG